jgi:hypothetical protein
VNSGMRVLYGPPIGEVIASGDLDRMKEVAKEAEEHLAEAGNVSAALQLLKVEIAKAEQQSQGGP